MDILFNIFLICVGVLLVELTILFIVSIGSMIYEDFEELKERRMK